MLFDSPIPFADALDSRKVKALLPTELSSGELAQIEPAIRERAIFMARNNDAESLQEVSNLVGDLLNPHTETRADGSPFTAGLDPATARLRMKQFLAEQDYAPAPEDAGTIKDFTSDKRSNLVLSMNTQMAQGYGQWKQGQDRDVLDAYPAQELFRLEARREPRDWLQRWRGAGGELRGGRMIALVNDPIWVRLSAFGIPYPPFDFNSGMWTRRIARETAAALGLIQDNETVEPQDRGFNDDLQLTPAIRSQGLIDALIALGYNFLNGVLTP